MFEDGFDAVLNGDVQPEDVGIAAEQLSRHLVEKELPVFVRSVTGRL